VAAALSDNPQRQKHVFRLAYGVLALAFWV